MLDLRNEDHAAEILSNLQPDLLVNTATLRSPLALNDLAPSTLRDLELGAGSGPWLPLQVVLPLKLMRARAAAGLSTPAINVSFPDAVNPVLKGLDLTPTCGAGNSDLLAAGIRTIVSQRLNVPVSEVAVYLSAHHVHAHLFVSGFHSAEALSDYPFWVRVIVHGTDVTEKLGSHALLAEAGLRMPRKRYVPSATAESVVKNGLRILRDDPTLTHAPGPAGHIGGYDVRLGRERIEIVWPDGMSRAEVEQMHITTQQKGDGIEHIRADGAVLYTDLAYRTMKGLFGYDCRILHPEEFEDRAYELSRRLDERVRLDLQSRANRHASK